ncbi:hypothetical protein Hanom_Chr09g00790911 [Helianthus anomalus]
MLFLHRSLATNPWTHEEDIALCESWVEAVCRPQCRSHAPLWVRILQQFSAHRCSHPYRRRFIFSFYGNTCGLRKL